jgi:hypothetical protein
MLRSKVTTLQLLYVKMDHHGSRIGITSQRLDGGAGGIVVPCVPLEELDDGALGIVTGADGAGGTGGGTIATGGLGSAFCKGFSPG